jgi:Uncharacterized conserved protein (COG2071)
MKIPAIRGVIDRRILVNFQVDPAVLSKFLPAPFSPKLASGSGIAGVCLIRLKEIRPRLVPSRFGISSENAAHRIAVGWTSHGQPREGVYIPRRDTTSRLNTLLGGRLFPGLQHPARFEVHEEDDSYSVALRSKDGQVRLEVVGRLASELPKESVFSSLEEASVFFERGSVGYSATPNPGRFDGLELRSNSWRVEPLSVERVYSSFFSNEKIFPEGSVRFDCALLMRDIEHEWHAREPLCQCEREAA